ncbi:MAG: hypothetical protein A2W19_16335 [Spirochaetes bacterium RBG_16_49_21]|nr:MAG: hypothetical protein A2W19_16335 [Spirochaetes bacterium RBG_16_49_21]
MSKRTIIFSAHAITKMFERKIGPSLVRTAVEQGSIINHYPDDRPYPSRLILFFHDEIPIHIVAADDENSTMTYIITVYIPDSLAWNEDFTKRRQQ